MLLTSYKKKLVQLMIAKLISAKAWKKEKVYNLIANKIHFIVNYPGVVLGSLTGAF